MVLFSAKRYSREELKDLIEQLKSIRGRHTELVSVYVPAGHNINEIKGMISSELGTASNIKSKTTRKNVLDALSRIGNALRQYTTTPENGLVIFSGNISDKEGTSDIALWEVEPPEPVKIKLYRCDQKFVTEPLEEMFTEREVYGLIAIDRQEAAVGFLRGKRIELAKRFESLVPGKTSKGGQSAARFLRVREGLLLAFKKEVGEIATKIFEEEENLQGIIIGGPGPLKYEFVEGDYLSEALKKKIIKVVDTGYAGEEALKEIVERAEEVLKESAYMREKQVLDKFFKMLKTNEELVVYGLKFVLDALEAGAVDTLILSEDIPFKAVNITCSSCNTQTTKIIRKQEDIDKCPKCGSTAIKKEEVNLIKYLTSKAEEFSTNVEVVSSKSPEGEQFLMMGGVAGILRYKWS